jgi:lysophospholipase L1-like esterase
MSALQQSSKPGATDRTYARFVAIGDSYTEGLDDPGPDGSFRGWADRFAGILAAANPATEYANLAIRGKRIDQVVAEQLPAAIALRPDLVSVAAGVNDVLRPKVDIEHVADQLEQSVIAIRNTGADVLLTCVGDPSRRSAVMARLASRLVEYDEHVRRIAREHEAMVMDFWGVALFDDERCWSIDRLHLSTIGHQRVALAAAELVGLGDDSWREVLPPTQPKPWLIRRRADVEWTIAYLGPWVGRRLRGTSSGDNVTAKRPQLQQVVPS